MGVRITTNSIEGYFATLKRGINGVYHHVGKQHLQRHLSELDCRYNSRKEKDDDPTLMALKSTGGKRLMLRDSRLPNLGGKKSNFVLAKTLLYNARAATSDPGERLDRR